MKLVKNTKLFVDLTNIMVVHIMNNEIGCFNQFFLREYAHETATKQSEAQLIYFGCTLYILKRRQIMLIGSIVIDILDFKAGFNFLNIEVSRNGQLC